MILKTHLIDYLWITMNASCLEKEDIINKQKEKEVMALFFVNSMESHSRNKKIIHNKERYRAS